MKLIHNINDFLDDDIKHAALPGARIKIARKV